MDYETQKTELIRMVNGLCPVINETVSKTLGMPCFFIATQIDKAGACITIEETSGAAKVQLTATPFLRRMFTDAQIYGYAYYFADENLLDIRFHVSYKHPGGGGNGRELGMLRINTKTKEVIKLPDLPTYIFDLAE